MKRSITAASAGLSAVVVSLPLLAGAPARAHVTYERPEAAAGSYYKGVLRVPHGCKGEATHTVRVTLPDELVGVKPMPKAGWSVSTTVGPYATPFDDHGRETREGVREIVWSGGKLEDGHFDEFAFFGRIRPEAAGVIHTPVVQDCASGSE
ncbi:MAG TPA: YcnI family protein, partial [Beijerinckiaceae bacterium]